mmetsp:Transcript_12394/g.1849  ORF Transcript_12394/g.1849 Transcript_12394/m.1849 type:complete len:113 (+) Transcript_12394:408-746(+)
MAMVSIKILQELNIQHGRIYFVLESEEESGSPHFNQHLQKFKPRVENLSAIINLDSTGGGYTNFWSVNSLRGCISAIVSISVLTQGMHSGHASGAVPSSFRILRELLDRLEN